MIAVKSMAQHRWSQKDACGSFLRCRGGNAIYHLRAEAKPTPSHGNNLEREKKRAVLMPQLWPDQVRQWTNATRPQSDDASTGQDIQSIYADFLAHRRPLRAATTVRLRRGGGGGGKHKRTLRLLQTIF